VLFVTLLKDFGWGGDATAGINVRYAFDGKLDASTPNNDA
jgi:hypothetical protein